MMDRRPVCRHVDFCKQCIDTRGHKFDARKFLHEKFFWQFAGLLSFFGDNLSYYFWEDF